MDSRERYAEMEVMFRAILSGSQKHLWTALPGYIVSFDADTVTASVQPGVAGIVTDKGGSPDAVSLPVLTDVPVVFPRGGGCTLTFPVTNGDECLIMFACRSIDAWSQSGGVQPPLSDRRHDLSDAFAIVGPMSQANKISGISTSTTQLRSNDGSTFVELDPTGRIVNVTAPGGMKITTPTLHITGDVNVDKTVTATTDVLGGGKSLKSHVHTGVTSGSGTSGPPQ
nr:Gp138 family membrane-puncturing spike protein [Rhodanobacter glycinis]